jgi:hypothetical protein
MSLKSLALAALALLAAVKPVSSLTVPRNSSNSIIPSWISPPHDPFSLPLPLNLNLTEEALWNLEDEASRSSLRPFPKYFHPAQPYVCNSEPGTPICETSSGSPNVDDVRKLIPYFRSDRKKGCYPTHRVNSKCKTMRRAGRSGVSVCIKPDMYRPPFEDYKEAVMDFGWFPCYNVAAYLEELIESCADGGKVGGMTRVPCYFEQYVVLHK